MSINRVAGRYAKSIIDLASDNNKLDVVLNDMEIFKKSLASRDLYLMLKSPIIHSDKKNKILSILFGDKFDKITMSFVDICVRKGRESILPEIIDEFIIQYNKLKKITTVTISTAQELPLVELEAIKQKLMLSTETGDKIEVIVKVKPELIGGYVVEIGDKLYDASILHKLETLKKQFSNNHYEKKLYK
jgi:F-type H+-transporting ATPase subunit delta